MKFNPKSECRKISLACLLLLIFIWVGHIAGCSSTSEQGAMPVIEPAPLSFEGQLAFKDGSVVELSTGKFVVGGEGKTVDRIDFNLTGGVLADGTPQLMRVEYRSELHGDWVRCGKVEFDVMGCTVAFTVPFHDQCGKSDAAVTCRPFRVKPAPEPDAAD